MLKTYRKYFGIYNEKGDCLFSDSYNCICDESDIKTEEKVYTWDNIEDLNMYFGHIVKKKKGRVYTLTSYFDEYECKEWKEKLKLITRVSYKECNMSLEDIMRIRNSDIAIEYLKQRGLNICPIKL